MLLFVSWRNKYAIIVWPLFDAPTSIHGVFTSFSISQYCCLHFWKHKVGSMLAQGFLRVKGQAKITKCYFLWVGAINMQSLSGHYLMRQKVLMAFLLPLVYLGAVAYISVEISLGLCWRRDILRVKGQALFTYCNFLWLSVICNCWVATIDAPASTHGVFTSLVYLSVVAYISVEISLGSCCCGDILRVKGQGFITNYNFLWLCVICNHREIWFVYHFPRFLQFFDVGA